jgi:excisionase family DNA binding protein
MSSNIKIQRICEHCNNEFTARTTVTRFCSHKCASAAHKQKVRDSKVDVSNRKTQQIKNQSIDILKAKEFLTVRDVATLLNSSIRTVYRWIEQGNIKAVNIAQRKTLIKRSDLDKLFKDPPKQVEPIPETQKQELNDWVQEGFNISDCYTLTEIQNKFGISEKALHDIIKRNNVPKIKKGWFAYVPKAIIDKILS